MAYNYFIGISSALAIAQVDRFTPANVEIGDIFTLAATGQDGSTAAVSFTATVATVANVTAGLVAAWNASTNPLHTPITAADATTSLTLTADTAGVPFSVASSTTDGGGANTQTLPRTAVTANRGPNDYNTALNWSLLAVPVAGDHVVIDGRQAAHIYYGLDQSGVDLGSFTRYQTAYAVGQTSIPLRIRSAVIDLNKPPTDGSTLNAPGLTNVDAGSAEATTMSVYGGYTQGTSGRANVSVKANHTDSVLNVYGGRVDVANNNPSDTGEFETIAVRGSGARVTLGSGLATLNNLNLREGGGAIVRCTVGTLDADGGGPLVLEGAAAVTNLITNVPTALNNTGTITALLAETNARLDTTQTSNERTITGASLYGGATLKTDLNTTYTNGIFCLRGAKSSQIDAGDDVVVSLAGT
jgi:hypothetical protein